MEKTRRIMLKKPAWTKNLNKAKIADLERYHGEQNALKFESRKNLEGLKSAWMKVIKKRLNKQPHTKHVENLFMQVIYLWWD
jgi:hypothetical protein